MEETAAWRPARYAGDRLGVGAILQRTKELAKRSFSFSARRYADGTVNGEVQLNSRGFDVFVHIKIDCLRLDGSTAYMSGLITYSSNPAEGVPGELNRWAVQDNGEGAGASPDMVSSIPANEGNLDPKTCEDDNSDRPISRTVQRGNVQVRGG